eukprot:TRINITY_DN20224_c0_g2_i6.p1 TRINITY_DN20224_c0_g2~~TRINITY_DN20224_c0_g2_i6.p1  ORF type:complete len:265 (-),score=26.77 TRINITY_DN20224_c0_g2_i6:193-987(-)
MCSPDGSCYESEEWENTSQVPTRDECTLAFALRNRSVDSDSDNSGSSRSTFDQPKCAHKAQSTDTEGVVEPHLERGPPRRLPSAPSRPRPSFESAAGSTQRTEAGAVTLTERGDELLAEGLRDDRAAVRLRMLKQSVVEGCMPAAAAPIRGRCSLGRPNLQLPELKQEDAAIAAMKPDTPLPPLLRLRKEKAAVAAQPSPSRIGRLAEAFDANRLKQTDGMPRFGMAVQRAPRIQDLGAFVRQAAEMRKLDEQEVASCGFFFLE